MRFRIGLAALSLLFLANCGGPDTEQVIGKDPAAVYAAFDQALTASDVDGAIGSGPNAVPYVVTVTKVPNQRLDIAVMID